MKSPRFFLYPSHSPIGAGRVIFELLSGVVGGVFVTVLVCLVYFKLGFWTMLVLFPFGAFLILEMEAFKNPADVNALNGYELSIFEGKVHLRVAVPLRPRLRYMGVEVESIEKAAASRVVHLVDQSSVDLMRLSPKAQQLFVQAYDSLKQFLQTGHLETPSAEFSSSGSDKYKYKEGYRKPVWLYWTCLLTCPLSWGVGFYIFYFILTKFFS